MRRAKPEFLYDPLREIETLPHRADAGKDLARRLSYGRSSVPLPTSLLAVSGTGVRPGVVPDWRPRRLGRRPAGWRAYTRMAANVQRLARVVLLLICDPP